MEQSGGVCVPIHQHIKRQLFVLYLYVLLTELKANLTELVVSQICSNQRGLCSVYRFFHQNTEMLFSQQ